MSFWSRETICPCRDSNREPSRNSWHPACCGV